MAVDDKYVMNGVWLTCDKGVTPSLFNVTPKPVQLYDEHFANELDKIPMVNILPFGACSVSHGPCVPAPVLWERVMEDGLTVLGARPLLDTSKCQCGIGGKISIHFTRADASAAAELDQKLDQVDAVADKAQEAAGWMFWGGLACAVGGAILVATGVGAPLGAALITGGSMAMRASTVVSAAATVTKAATSFARDPSRENGLSIVGQAAKDIAIDYIMNKVGGAVVKRLGRAAQKAMNRLGISERASKLANRILCKTTGHPVDVISGYLYTETVDFELPGPIPLRWERLWNSTSIHEGPLGHGWHHGYDMALFVDAEQDVVAFRAADGRGLAFDLVPLGERAFNRLEKMTLLHDERGYAVLDHNLGLHYRFGPDRGDGVRALLAVENANGFAIRFSYDERGYLAGIVDSAQRPLQVSCDAQGRVLTITAPHPTEPRQTVVVVEYSYNDRGALISCQDALRQTATYHYEQHLLVQETFKNGLSFYFEYEGVGPAARCYHTWGDEGIYNHTLAYDPQARRTVVTNSLGHATTYQGNENGLVVETLDARGGVSRTEYNEYNETLRETDPLGQATTYEYDERGNCVSTTLADGAQLKREYDVQGNCIAAIDAVGGRWQWAYDEAGNLSERTNPTGHTNRYTYADGLLLAITDATRRTSTFSYDAQGNLVEVQDSAGQRSRRLYDAWGQVRKAADARGNVQWREYDLLGRVVTVHEPDGNVRRFTYDALNNLARSQDRHHNVEYVYRGMGRMIRRVEAGTAVEFLHDTEEQLRAIVNEHGLTYRFELDGEGDVITEAGFDGLTRRYQRDAGGRVMELELPTGQRTRYGYNLAGRVTHVAYGDGSTETYAYGPDGALLQATNDTISVAFTRDGGGRVLQETQGEHTVTSAYNAQGNRTGLTSSLGAAVRYMRDEQGAVAQMQVGSWQALFERDAQGLEVQRTLSGGVRARWKRDQLGRPIEQCISVGLGGRSAECTRTYSWQAGERLTRIEDSQLGLTQFEHDAVGNLAATTFGDGSRELRLPDAVGNLFTTASQKDRRYGPAGQLLEAQGTRYAYDEAGNLASKTTAQGQQWHYSWNTAGHLVEVVRPDGGVVRFTYDALGRRVSKSYQGQVTRWVWDDNQPLHEWSELETEVATDAVITKVVTWLFEDGRLAPVAKVTPEGNYSIITDHLGSPLILHDASGTATWQAQLNGYGAIRQSKGQAQDCPFRYQGQYEDLEVGLYYNRFRYYDPESGQYISQDPIRLDGGLSLYEYVTDPNVWVDPFGQADLFELGTYGSLNSSTHVGDKLQAHELIRHEYLVQKGLANKANRLSGNPSIALDNAHHTKVGGAHWHEAQIRAKQGLGRNEFHLDPKRELDITQGGLRKAGVKASTARRLRKQSDKFYKKLLKKPSCP